MTEGNIISRKQASKRISWLDVAKGLGIFFIVWGHVLRTGHFRIYLYAFNVTLFFFLLGYTFKYGGSLMEFFKKRFLRTMVPYYIWAVISIIIFISMRKFLAFDVTNASMSLWKNLVGMIYANSRTIYMRWNLPLWFIPCMNLTLVMVWLLECIKQKRIKTSEEKVRIGVCLFLAIAGLIMQRTIDIKFPFQFESAVLMTSFVELGLIFKNKKIIEKISQCKVSLLICIVLLIVGLCSAEANGIAEVRSYDYGKCSILFLFSACAMTWLVSLISCKIKSNVILERVGQISFPILLMHKFPILFFQSVLPITRNLLAKPDTVEGLLCSFAVACITVGMCYIGTVIIKKIAPVIIGGVTAHCLCSLKLSLS